MNKEVSCSKSRDLCPEVPLKSACDLMADKEEGVDGLKSKYLVSQSYEDL